MLRSIMRQDIDNPILEYATRIRNNYKKADQRAIQNMMDGYGVEVLPSTVPSPVIIEHLSDMFCSPQFYEDPDYGKVIAWKNTTVNKINKQVRQLIYKEENLPVLMIGDRLVIDAPVISGKKIILHNSDEVDVISFTAESMIVEFFTVQAGEPKEDKAAIGYYDTVVEYTELSGTKTRHKIRIVHDSSVAHYKSIMEGIPKAAYATTNRFLRSDIWKKFYALQKKFANVKYNYAITAHKAQLGPYIVNCWNPLRA